MQVNPPRAPSFVGSVLVVEDDVDIRDSVTESLADAGYQVFCVGNGAEALDFLRTRPAPSVILLDLMMPEMDGWQFRVEQRKDSALASIPVVAMTANNSPQAAAIDADAFLAKPFTTRALLEQLEHVARETLHEQQAQAERMISLGRLASGVAHEINNPLAYVMANLGMLRDRLLPLMRLQRGTATPQELTELDDYEGMLLDALEGAERIRGIVRDIQTVAQVRQERLEPVQVLPILKSSLKLAWNRIQHRARLEESHAPLPAVTAEAGRLGQVFLNLLLNAADAIPEGHSEENLIRVVTREAEQHVVVEISDTGEGISKERLARIFDPFFTTKPIGSGTGLGLFICQGIVASFGGAIEVESQLGGGSTFRVCLPRAVSQAQAEANQAAAMREATGRLGLTRSAARPQVLIVDDNLLLGRALARELEEECHVRVVASGREALEVLREETFALVLCDLHMPDLTGMDVYETLQKLQPGAEKRLVFMTGGVFSERAQAFVQSVPNPVIEKPVNLGRLRPFLQPS